MKPLAPTMVFRQGGPNDASALLELSRRTVIDTFAHLNNPANFARFLDEHYRLDRVQSDLVDPHVTIFLGEVEGVPGAYSKLASGPVPECVGDPEAMQIVRFYVDKPYLGTGVAGQMMRLCLDHARRCGRQTVFLGVWEHNARAIRFYQKWGFIRCGQGLFRVGEDEQTDWWMVRSLER
ncbi:MAG: GNAT family N-acetyltransferase [Phycisphaerales bacterium]|nr:GNAT family N-acetyltransferase [Phycisphaerales bacterium]